MVKQKSRLSHVYGTFSDLPAARRFWVDLIGLEVLVDGEEYVRLGSSGGYSLGMEQAPEGEAPELEIVVRVPDVDAAYERLQGAGVETGGPPEDMAWGARHIWLRDPDGHLISIYSSSDEDAK